MANHIERFDQAFSTIMYNTDDLDPTYSVVDATYALGAHPETETIYLAADLTTVDDGYFSLSSLRTTTTVINGREAEEHDYMELQQTPDGNITTNNIHTTDLIDEATGNRDETKHTVEIPEHSQVIARSSVLAFIEAALAAHAEEQAYA